MAQKYVVVERKNPLKPQEPAKFYLTKYLLRYVKNTIFISLITE